MSEKPNRERVIYSRFLGSEFEEIENYRRALPQIPSLSQAIRSLVKQSLAARDTKLPSGKDRLA